MRSEDSYEKHDKHENEHSREKDSYTNDRVDNKQKEKGDLEND